MVLLIKERELVLQFCVDLVKFSPGLGDVMDHHCKSHVHFSQTLAISLRGIRREIANSTLQISEIQPQLLHRCQHLALGPVTQLRGKLSVLSGEVLDTLTQMLLLSIQSA